MTRPTIAIFLLLAAIPGTAGVKVAGTEFVPKDLIFASPDSQSQASAEGPLADECQWRFTSETRLGKREDGQRCIRFYMKTTVTLVQICPGKDVPLARRTAERVTATENRCPDASGKVNAPSAEARAISSGVTVDGKQQEIVLQPDGTRITLSHDRTGIVVVGVFPDGTVDVLKVP